MFIVTDQYQGCRGDAVAGLAANMAQAERIVARIKLTAKLPLEFVKYLPADPRKEMRRRRIVERFDPEEQRRVKPGRRRGRGSPLRKYNIFNTLGYRPEPWFVKAQRRRHGMNGVHRHA